MARYFRISPQFWPDTRGWGDDARLVALYILTCPHRTTEGLFRFHREYGAADMQWLPERFAQGFEELIQSGFLAYDAEHGICLIRRALKWQAPANPNGVKAAMTAVEGLPETPLLREFITAAEQFCEPLAHALQQRYGEGLAYSPSPSPSPSPPPVGGSRGGAASPTPTPPRRARRRKPEPPDPNALPSTLDPSLHQTVYDLAALLARLSEAKGAAPVVLAAVGRVVASYPRHDHARVAAEFEHYWTFGNGAGDQMRDVVASYRNRLDRLPAPPNGVTPAAARGTVREREIVRPGRTS